MNKRDLKVLQGVAAQASALAADMNRFADAPMGGGRGNVEAVIFTIEQLAQAVYRSDSADPNLSVEMAAHVLELAFKRVGMFSLAGKACVIDLGNGHLLSCSARKAH